MDMMLNSLPSRTWNRLGINESFIKIEESFAPNLPEADGPGGSALWEERSGREFPTVPTGMGKDVVNMVASSPVSLVETAPGAVMEAPMVLRYSFEEGEHAVSRLRLHAKEGSTLSVVVLLASPKGSKGSSVMRTEVMAEKNAKVRLSVAQLLGSGFVCLNDIGAVCEEKADFALTKLELGSGRLYAGTAVDLNGEESNFTTQVGYHVHTIQTVDMNYVATHHGKRTTSLMEVNGTLEEGAHKVFRGTIDFPRGCAGAKGTENENVLLMGDDMVNQTIPLILCKEEDVEGNHGASIGQLDDKVLFYLGSRGISEKDAQKIISQSRIDAVCDRIPDESVRKAVHGFEL